MESQIDTQTAIDTFCDKLVMIKEMTSTTVVLFYPSAAPGFTGITVKISRKEFDKNFVLE